MDQIARTLDLEALKGWVGREESVTDHLDLRTFARISAFFGTDTDIRDGDAVGETLHWCFFHPAVAPDQLGTDGHPRTGGFLPPFDLPRRMWGGSKLTFHEPLRAGQPAEKMSRVLSVDLKNGKSGTLGLVKVEHLISQQGVLCRREEQDIVYREAAKGSQGKAAEPACPEGAEASTTFTADSVTLFRYSALTYNAHRIHYDRSYATAEEGYPALVVHGPLTATLLARFSRSGRDNAPMTSYAFRGTSPLFDSAPFVLHARNDGEEDTLWAESPDGGMAMTATAGY